MCSEPKFGECICAQLRRLEDASGAFSTALELDANNANALANMGRVMLQLGDIETAILLLDGSLSRQPGVVDVWILLGKVVTMNVFRSKPFFTLYIASHCKVITGRAYLPLGVLTARSCARNNLKLLDTRMSYVIWTAQAYGQVHREVKAMETWRKLLDGDLVPQGSVLEGEVR